MTNDEILTGLNRRLDIYDKLAMLAETQQVILMENKLSELPENLAGFDPLLLELEQIERREESSLVLPEDENNLFSGETRKIASSIIERAGQLSRLTALNKQLLQDAMNFVDFSIGIICRAASPTSDPGSRAILLDAKV